MQKKISQMCANKMVIIVLLLLLRSYTCPIHG